MSSATMNSITHVKFSLSSISLSRSVSSASRPKRAARFQRLRNVSRARKVSRFPAVLLFLCSSVSPLVAAVVATAQIESRDYSPCVTPTFLPEPRLNPSGQTIFRARSTDRGERKISPYATRVDNYSVLIHHVSSEMPENYRVFFHDAKQSQDIAWRSRIVHVFFLSEKFSFSISFGFFFITLI